jgi:hypothetical protein
MAYAYSIKATSPSESYEHKVAVGVSVLIASDEASTAPYLPMLRSFGAKMDSARNCPYRSKRWNVLRTDPSKSVRVQILDSDIGITFHSLNGPSGWVFVALNSRFAWGSPFHG